MVDEAVVNTVRKYLRTLDAQGIPAPFGVVYGSQARGTTHEWSDIDLLVVSPMFDKQRKREDWVNI
ncbi:MAG: nucleotidyltransferase domain-containing protein [Chloroflexi bacterium]|nr:nucleotidyltransferase domain-containing protein [Chloroflexota bacterium]MBU1660993.1 nucleotidyltransferase domain-containing protein [Chloroflexota bacterium]